MSFPGVENDRIIDSITALNQQELKIIATYNFDESMLIFNTTIVLHISKLAEIVKDVLAYH
jgi:hypothetical protein